MADLLVNLVIAIAMFAAVAVGADGPDWAALMTGIIVYFIVAMSDRVLYAVRER